MNKPVIQMTIVSLLGLVLLAGCFAASPQVSYYSLYAPAHRPASAAAGTPGDTLAVSVGPVTIPDILKQTKIATGGTDGRYRLAEYHRWSGELDRDLARAVAEQLSGRLGTEQVALFPWDQNFTTNIRVFIDVLSMGGEPGKEATLSVRWALVDPQGQRPQVIRRSELRETPAEAGYHGWVAAQQQNVAQLAEEIAALVKTLPQ